jgi:ribosome-associated toxin RatA of RatAB toxin-antitoxin module
VLDRLVGPVFNQIAATFVDAFVRRADALHPRA